MPSYPAFSFFALTATGLETLVAQELTQLPQCRKLTLSYRRISGIFHGPPIELCAVRTADDVFLHLAHWTGIIHQRSALLLLQQLGATLKLFPALQLCRTLRTIPSRPHFSISVSFVGKRNYSGEEIKALLGQTICATHPGWMYSEDDRLADLNVRIFIEHEQAVIGVRLAQTALHDRGYRRAQIPGALKASVAAAMLRLSQFEPGMSVLDPCCGSGTLLIEAALQGALASGGDYHTGALEAARINAQAANVQLALQRWDARELPLATASYDRVVTNLPWGRQVGLLQECSVLYQQILRELQRVLKPSGKLVVLTNQPEALPREPLRCQADIQISLFGQRPSLLLFEHECIS